jgi:hypothetical protein
LTHPRGGRDELGRLTFPFPLSSTALFPCKTLLLMLSIVGLATARLEIKEGGVALPIEKL